MLFELRINRVRKFCYRKAHNEMLMLCNLDSIDDTYIIFSLQARENMGIYPDRLKSVEEE
jgi:hypothetical protein